MRLCLSRSLAAAPAQRAGWQWPNVSGIFLKMVRAQLAIVGYKFFLLKKSHNVHSEDPLLVGEQYL